MRNLGIKNKKISILFILLFCGGEIFWSTISVAVTPKDQYYKAEACYRNLRNNKQTKKYRDNWMRCIEKFQSVHQLDPSGPWAAAGLYMSGELFRELAKYSGKKSDLQEALDIYKRIVKRFPNSRYRKKAERAIRAIASNDTAIKASDNKAKIQNRCHDLFFNQRS